MNRLVPRGVSLATHVRPFQVLQSEMNELFRDFLDDDAGSRGNGWIAAPAVDLAETPDAFVLRAELPGMDSKDLDIQVTGDLLSISGEKREEDQRKDAQVHFSERRFGRWQRAFRLPTSADAGRVEARMTNGVLEVTVGKRAEAKPQRIAVKNG